MQESVARSGPDAYTVYTKECLVIAMAILQLKKGQNHWNSTLRNGCEYDFRFRSKFTICKHEFVRPLAITL